MDPSLQQAVASIQLKDYMSLVIITAVGYDYALTFSNEMEYIWNKPWTWVSTLFVLARYSGLCSAISFAIYVCALPRLYTTYHVNRCNLIELLGAWSFLIFIGAVDLVMILRLWALYNRSRIILGALLMFYATEVIAFFIFYVVDIVQIHHGPIVDTTHVLQLSFCTWKNLSTTWSIVLDVVQLTLAVLMCFLIVVKFIVELLQTRKVTKHFQLNRYVKLIVWEGTICFTAVLGFAILNVLNNARVNLTGKWRVTLTIILQLQIPPITLVPRFILSLRELFARDLRGRQGSDMDTAFGLTSGPWSNAAASAIMFADARQDEEEKQGDKTQMEGGPDSAR